MQQKSPVLLPRLALLAGCAAPDGARAPTGAADAPLAEVRIEHDYVSQPPRNVMFDIPPATALYDVRLQVGTDGTAVCGGGQRATLAVFAPDGATFAELRSDRNTVLTAGQGNSPCDAWEQASVDLEGGVWTVRFDGRTPATGLVEIVPSSG